MAMWGTSNWGSSSHNDVPATWTSANNHDFGTWKDFGWGNHPPRQAEEWQDYRPWTAPEWQNYHPPHVREQHARPHRNERIMAPACIPPEPSAQALKKLGSVFVAVIKYTGTAPTASHPLVTTRSDYADPGEPMSIATLQKALRFRLDAQKFPWVVAAEELLEWKFMSDYPGVPKEWKICLTSTSETRSSSHDARRRH